MSASIQAIETTFNGYKMRSRLEARWARCFEELGIRWEYEAQGFDLNGTRYLPDFWFPDFEMHVEIKPLLEPVERCLSIYMAGKIAQNDWRHDLVPYLTGHTAELMPRNTVFGGVYTGPFFTCAGHGLDYVPSQHGQEVDGEGDCATQIVKNSFEQISKADVVFAWLEDETAYGSLVEIGYALALKKQVWIGLERQFHERLMEDLGFDSRHNPEGKTRIDLWFPWTAAEKNGVFDGATQALASFVPELDEAARRALLLARQSKGRVLLLRGTPDPTHSSYRASMFYGNGQYTIGRRLALVEEDESARFRPFETLAGDWHYPETELRLKSALAKARAARFEWGENG